MRLLLLGCTGFIGRELIPDLLNDGHHLTVISRKPPKKFLQNLLSDRLVNIQIDPALQSSWEDESLINALSKSEAVINLAGEPIAEKRWTIEHCEIIKNSRICTTSNLITAMSQLKIPPKFLLNASAIGYYGTSSNKLFNETSSSGDDFLAQVCSEWEEIASKKPNATRLVLLRIGIVLGSDGGALGKMLPIFRAGFGGPLGNGEQWMSWIHRSDLCKIIKTTLLDKSWKGVINGVAPNPSKMFDFSATLGKILGRPTLLPVPGKILKLLLGDGAKVVLEGQNVNSLYLKKLNFKFKYEKLSNALEYECNLKKKV